MNRRRMRGEGLVLASLSMILYNTGTMMFLYLVPLQIIAVRWGKKAFFHGMLFSLAGILTLRSFIIRGVDAPWEILVMDLAALLIMTGGLILVDYAPWENTLARFAAALALAALVLIPCGLFFASLGEGRGFAPMILETLNTALGETLGFETTAELARIVTETFFMSYLPIFLGILGLNWWLGLRWGARTMGGNMVLPDSRKFRLPKEALWFLLIPLTLFLLKVLGIGEYGDGGILKYVLANTGLTALALFGLQGVGILQCLMERRSWSPRVRSLVIMAIVTGLFLPGIRLLVVIVVPGLGVSERWVRYRYFDMKENAVNENHSI